MPTYFYLSGYHVSFQKVREAMKKLEIPDKGVIDEILAYPISDWLAKNKKKRPLPVALRYPTDETSEKVNGIFFITHFLLCDSKSQNPNVEIDGGYHTLGVKNWMIEKAGLKAEDLTWVSLWDDNGLTDEGFIPRENNRKRPDIELTPGEVAEFRASGKPLREIFDFIDVKRGLKN